MADVAGVALGEIARQLGGELIGDAGIRIDRIGALEGATPSTLAYFSNPRLQAHLGGSRAGCVIVGLAARDAGVARGAAIVTPDPHLYFARLTQWWVARSKVPMTTGVHPSALVDPSAHVAAGAWIGPFVVIEAGVTVADGAEIGAHCFLGANSHVGPCTHLSPRVTLAAGCTIGARGIVHSGAVIGADGFGFAPTEGRWEKIEQLGGVRIGDDVEIGANTCIDRGALDDTVIGDGVKLDNQIQIGHNVRIGAHTALAGCAGVAGSAVIGKHCTIGGAGMVVGHIELADHVHISAGSMVMRSIRKPGVYTGVFPIDENAAWEKNAATLRQLHSLRDRLRVLEKSVLENKAPDPKTA